MAFGKLLKAWCLTLGGTLVAVIICIYWLDTPVAKFFLPDANRLSTLGAGFSSAVLVTGELGLIAILAITRMIRGYLPDVAKVLFVACGASLSALIANDYVLKLIFGRQNPSELLYEAPKQVFHFFQGGQSSSFPSGHMVMATAFAAAVIRLSPRAWPGLVALLFIGAVALVIGDWHFIGDVIAGAFVGGTAGFVAGELWLEHMQQHGLT